MVNLVFASDHAGVELKTILIRALSESNYSVKDLGPSSKDSVDYPDYAHPLAQSIDSSFSDLGILICGSGNGVCMTANKYANVRAALCWEPSIAALARQHNNANVVCIPARFVSVDSAIQIMQTFLNTAFEGGRHERRVQKIACS
tara:strand:+ start:603 stop:1037 length:435 start_codon:yes stop_codon:yes gene_type:complete